LEIADIPVVRLSAPMQLHEGLNETPEAAHAFFLLLPGCNAEGLAGLMGETRKVVGLAGILN